MKSQDIFLDSFIKFVNWLWMQVETGRITKFRIGEVWRRQVTQDWLLKKGWTKVKHSRHQNFQAADIFIWIDGEPTFKIEGKNKNGKWKHLEKLSYIGEYWESLHPNNRAGMFWKTIRDPSHFETQDKPAKKGLSR